MTTTSAIYKIIPQFRNNKAEHEEKKEAKKRPTTIGNVLLANQQQLLSNKDILKTYRDAGWP